MRDLAGYDWAMQRGAMLKRGDGSESKKEGGKFVGEEDDGMPAPVTELNAGPEADHGAAPKTDPQAKPAKKKKKKLTPEEEAEKRRLQRERRANRPGAGVIALED